MQLSRKSLAGFVQLFRLPNLLLVAATMWFLRLLIILPVLDSQSVTPHLNGLHFHLLVLATVLVTWGGYLINDWYDYDIDLVNKPDKTVIGQLLSRKQALWLYFLSQVGGALLSTWLAAELGLWKWLFLYPLSVIALWLYSAYLKKSLLTGNILVSLFTAGVALLVLLSEQESLKMAGYQHHLMDILWFYSLFAFLSNFLREVVKDAQDAEGDAQFGARTLPVLYGLYPPALLSRILLCLICLLCLIFIYLQSERLGVWSLSAIGVLLIYPLALMSNQAIYKYTRWNWSRMSLYAKMLMLGGLLALLFV